MTKFHISIIQILQNITFSTFIQYTNTTKTSNNTISIFCQKITIFDILPYFCHFWQIYYLYHFPPFTKNHHFSPFLQNHQKSPFSYKWSFPWKYQKYPNLLNCCFPQNDQFLAFLEMGKIRWDPEIGKIGQIPKNGVFREILQNWDFGGCSDEHTRKAWYDNYFQINP